MFYIKNQQTEYRKSWVNTRCSTADTDGQTSADKQTLFLLKQSPAKVDPSPTVLEMHQAKHQARLPRN